MIKVKWLKITDSTNNFFKEAKEILKNSNFSAFVVVADEQTAGRGRCGRSWISSKGGLWFTFYKEVDTAKDALKLHFAASISVYEVICTLFSIVPLLKWPNDVFFHNRKLCGILTEFKQKIVAVGIGININNMVNLQTPSLYKPISLSEIIGKKVNFQTFSRLFGDIVKKLNSFSSLSMEEIIRLWKSKNTVIGKRIRVHSCNIEGIVKDILSDGSLVVETNEGVEKVIQTGDVIIV